MGFKYYSSKTPGHNVRFICIKEVSRKSEKYNRNVDKNRKDKI